MENSTASSFEMFSWASTARSADESVALFPIEIPFGDAGSALTADDWRPPCWCGGVSGSIPCFEELNLAGHRRIRISAVTGLI